MVDTCPYTFVQTHTMYTTKSEPQWKLWTLSDDDVPLWVHQRLGKGYYMGNLYLSLSFAVT